MLIMCAGCATTGTRATPADRNAESAGQDVTKAAAKLTEDADAIDAALYGIRKTDQPPDAKPHTDEIANRSADVRGVAASLSTVTAPKIEVAVKDYAEAVKRAERAEGKLSAAAQADAVFYRWCSRLGALVAFVGLLVAIKFPSVGVTIFACGIAAVALFGAIARWLNEIHIAGLVVIVAGVAVGIYTLYRKGWFATPATKGSAKLDAESLEAARRGDTIKALSLSQQSIALARADDPAYDAAFRAAKETK